MLAFPPSNRVRPKRLPARSVSYEPISAPLVWPFPPSQEFVDDGYSGATLIRPALERLRDTAAAGGIDRRYVHFPNRLVANSGHRALLLEKLLKMGVEVIFLTREVEHT